MEHKEYIRIVPGSKHAVLMIHGIVGTPKHFEPFLPLIPEDWTVYNLLLDGHGKGVKEFAQTSMKKWKSQVAARVREILDTHDTLVIAAHSMGCLFAVQTAIRHREQVKGLFLLAIPLRPFLKPATALASAKAALGFTGSKMVREMLSDSGVKLTKNLFAYLGWIPRFWELLVEAGATRKLLPKLQTPAVAFVSRKDELVAFSTRNDLKDHPWIETVILPDSGHFAYGEKDLELLKARFTEALNKAKNGS